MKPYFETDLGKLYNGDCLEVMDELIAAGVKVDCIITDPPYGMSFQSGYRQEKHMKIANDDNLDWLDEWVNKLDLMLNENSHIYSFVSHHYVEKFKIAFQNKFQVKNILIWEKNNTGMGDLKGDYAPKYEMILYLQKGYKELNGSRDANIIKSKRTSNELHPTQKPNDLIKYLIEKSTNENDLIIDTFSGSGTLAEASEQLNRRWICIELEQKYCDITVQRFKNGVQQTLL